MSPRKGKYIAAKVYMLDDTVQVFHIPVSTCCVVPVCDIYEACNLSNRFSSVLCGLGANFHQSLRRSKEATFVFHFK